jgi:hypothetical protein
MPLPCSWHHRQGSPPRAAHPIPHSRHLPLPSHHRCDVPNRDRAAGSVPATSSLLPRSSGPCGRTRTSDILVSTNPKSQIQNGRGRTRTSDILASTPMIVGSFSRIRGTARPRWVRFHGFGARRDPAGFVLRAQRPLRRPIDCQIGSGGFVFVRGAPPRPTAILAGGFVSSLSQRRITSLPSDRAGTLRGTIRGGLMGGRLPSAAILRIGDRPEPDHSAPANRSCELSKIWRATFNRTVAWHTMRQTQAMPKNFGKDPE